MVENEWGKTGVDQFVINLYILELYKPTFSLGPWAHLEAVDEYASQGPTRIMTAFWVPK